MISFQTRSVSTKTHMLKIGFSAKLGLRRSVSQKKNMHRLVTQTQYDHELFVDFFTYSQESCLIVYSDWISSAIDLVVPIIYLPPKRQIQTKKTHPLLCHSAHFFQPAAVSCACEFGCAQVVFCACVPRTSSPPPTSSPGSSRFPIWRRLQGGKTFCASFCASLTAGSRRAFLCVDFVFVCCWSSE